MVEEDRLLPLSRGTNTNARRRQLPGQTKVTNTYTTALTARARSPIPSMWRIARWREKTPSEYSATMVG